LRSKAIDSGFLAEMTTAFPSIDVPREHAKFNDYRLSKGRRYKDDRAAFRNWLRKAEEFAGRGPGRSKQSRLRGGMDADAIAALREA
jgi:hypothetical protein